MKRQKLRRYAFLIVFGMSVSKDSPSEAMENYLESFKDDYLAEDGEFTEKDLEFVRDTVHGVYENADEIDSVITRYSKGYDISRISRDALAALRISIYEILKRDDIPYSVSVNEAVETVKAYEDEKTKKFVNGILGTLISEKNQ